MSNKHKSQCACGAVVVSIQGPPAVMAYCHCDSCRSWLGAPLHAASLWPTDGVVLQQGNEHLAVYKRTEESHRHFCTECGAPVLIRHPVLGLTDVPAGSVSDLKFEPTIHVNYAERVLDMRDGLPKFAGMPAADGSGTLVEE